MSACQQSERVQFYLDGDLPFAEAEAFQAHLSSCAACALEVSLYRRVMDSVARAAQWDPSRDLAERVLDEVLPERIRRRWARRFATGYAAALVATLAGIAAIISQPAARESGMVLASAGARGMVQSLALGMHGLSVVLTGLASGWGLIEALGQRFAPLARAFATLFRDTGVALPVVVAVAASVAVFAWMRSREARTNRGTPRVGVLGV